MKPNIFSIATKELSQDAFIAWLLQWADPKNQQYDEELHQCGVAFLKALLAKREISLEAGIKSIDVKTQFNRIDVFVTLTLKNGENYIIIIEDKVFSGVHGNQLERYKSYAEDQVKNSNAQVVLIYTKTRFESDYTLNKVGKHDFVVFGTRDFAEYFNLHVSENHIFNDFAINIKNYHKVNGLFMDKPISEWAKSDEIHKGFLVALEKIEGIYSWSRVNNPSGGFWCGNVNWDCWGESMIPVILQLEGQKLTFKLVLNPIELQGALLSAHQKSRIRNHWYEILISKSRSIQNSKIRKPGRFGHGNTMTFAVVNSEDWLGKPDSFVDIYLVKETIDFYKNILRTCMAENEVPQEFLNWIKKD